MNSKKFETPVAMFVFNRPDTTRRVFEAISNARPTRLLLVADGPREGREGEAHACQQVRDIVGGVDWPCKVSTNFSEKNLGCQERMISGLDWVFSLVEEAIILEDDCLPHASFFPFCAQLLELYREDDRVAYVCGCNLIEKYLKTNASYFFSHIGGIWGWATWRSEWRRYDRNLKDWPALKSEGILSELFEQPRAVAHLTQVFDMMHDGTGPNTWDHQWLYTCLKNNSLVAVPSVNLIVNIGFGPGATHTTEEDARFVLPAKPMEFPIRHPLSFIPLRSMDCLRAQDMYSMPIFHRILRKFRRIANRLFQ